MNHVVWYVCAPLPGSPPLAVGDPQCPRHVVCFPLGWTAQAHGYRHIFGLVKTFGLLPHSDGLHPYNPSLAYSVSRVPRREIVPNRPQQLGSQDICAAGPGFVIYQAPPDLGASACIPNRWSYRYYSAWAKPAATM